jgi:hypothetical protein
MTNPHWAAPCGADPTNASRERGLDLAVNIRR